MNISGPVKNGNLIPSSKLLKELPMKQPSNKTREIRKPKFNKKIINHEI